MDKHTDEELSDPVRPVDEWAERPEAVTGLEAVAIGRLLLDDVVPGSEVVRRARRGPASLSRSGAESPVLRFRVPAEDADELDAVAAASHLQKSELLRQGLRLVLDQYRDVEGRVATRPAAEAARTIELSETEAAVLRAVAQRVAS
ncbi:hypothetical protein [Frondihabitans australicus]|uniref:Ribbon-helix-helix CopG family protein n=1 Tax=Frondihabitans australicus TaxID=386892 RepID=A0A495ILW4_9MICO|nr:hypothetical protein [Frondihabitans australicus]RKR76156.1 hypothetical protein C8E83_3321 [Frondihabitans australicus]